MSYTPIITTRAIIFELEKPIYGSFYGIWDKWLKIAKQRNLNIIVKTKEGTSTFTYQTYMEGAKKMERYYKNPKEPMIFYGRSFLSDVKKRTERKKQEKKQTEQIRIFDNLELPDKYKKIWRDKLFAS